MAVRMRHGVMQDPTSGLWWVVLETTTPPAPPVTSAVAGPFITEALAEADARSRAAVTRAALADGGLTLIDGGTAEPPRGA